MAQTLYFSRSDLQNRLSADGVSYRTDDAPPGTDRDVYAEASSIIDEHCWVNYDPVQLATSDWVRHRATDIGAVLFCEDRGNPAPPGTVRRYERTMERLELVRLGQLLIPGLPLRKASAPVVSNVRVQQFPYPHTVVERSRSTGKAEGYSQRTDPLDDQGF